MKLRNKKTGEIGYTAVLQSKAIFVMDKNAIQLGSYTSLAELNKEWEDYEEPKRLYFVDTQNGVVDYFELYSNYICDVDFNHKIGNYFETKEEAEKAVEKLKAWKRLNDKRFRFVGWQDSVSDNNPDMVLFKLAENKWGDSTIDDLNLLFGGEE